MLGYHGTDIGLGLGWVVDPQQQWEVGALIIVLHVGAMEEEEEVGDVAQVLVVVDVEVTAAGSQSLLVFWFGIYRATAGNGRTLLG